MSPLPFSSILNTSITGDFSRFRIRHVPSVLTTVWSPDLVSKDFIALFGLDLHSRKAAVKFIQMFPSQLPRPSRLTLPGNPWVSSSSSRRSIPSLSRNPTTILGTPRRKDCAQNLSSLRSYLSFSLSLINSAVVFSSTQLIGSSLRTGLQSQTVTSKHDKKEEMREVHLLASTSPPITNFAFPKPVRTTEQYWALLFTTS